MDDAAARRRLLRWYGRGRRDLPWRRTRDPYAIWVSEVMLQQTRVEAAAPYFARWMARFPTVESLAAAPLHDVLRLWEGLGYYARARNLHRAARTVAARRGGRLPASSGGLRALPGFGPYTAAAVASIAFGEPVAAVDCNVVRVLARLEAVTEAADRPRGRRRIEAAARRLVAPRRPGDWNQALMDLGATVCRPRRPRCGECPLAALCEARRRGLQDRLPRKSPRRPPARARLHFAVVEDAGRLLLVQNREEGPFGGLWQLPGGAAGRALGRWVREQAGVRVRLGPRVAEVRHELTHRTWEMAVRRARLAAGAGAAPGARWVPIADLASWPLSAAMGKALAAAGFSRRVG